MFVVVISAIRDAKVMRQKRNEVSRQLGGLNFHPFLDFPSRRRSFSCGHRGKGNRIRSSGTENLPAARLADSNFMSPRLKPVCSVEDASMGPGKLKGPFPQSQRSMATSTALDCVNGAAASMPVLPEATQPMCGQAARSASPQRALHARGLAHV